MVPRGHDAPDVSADHQKIHASNGIVLGACTLAAFVAVLIGVSSELIHQTHSHQGRCEFLLVSGR